MARKSALLKFKTVYTDITLEGCRSHCPQCPAMQARFCQGCTKCDYNNNCSHDCADCCVRCWQRDNLNDWIGSIDGISLNAKPSSVFSSPLPFFLPQIKDKVWNVHHPFYIINIKTLVNPISMRWLYRKKSLHEYFQIPHTTKLILSFCAKDQLIEDIWTYQNKDWGNQKNFWQSLADFNFDASMSIDYSCFSNHPRMEHAINIKRNVLSASRIPIPIILDVMFHSENDLDRIVRWGKDNNISCFNLNFQLTKKEPWVLDLILKSCDHILSSVPKSHVIVTGIADIERASMLAKHGSISIANASVYIKTQYRMEHIDGRWLKTKKPIDQLWADNLKIYGVQGGY